MSSDRPLKKTAGWLGAASMTGRALTALVGGYASAAALSSLLARLLPGSPAEASAWGMIVSFLLFACLALWAFHERRLVYVAAVLWGSALLAGGAVMALGVRP